MQSIFYYDYKSEYSHMLVINVLKSVKITYMILEFILKNKDLILNNYSVLKNIFVNQLHLNHKINFDKCLYFMYNDQKIVKLIHECKYEQIKTKFIYNHHE